MRRSFLVALLGIALYGTPGASQENKNLPEGLVRRLGVDRQALLAGGLPSGLLTTDERTLVMLRREDEKPGSRNLALIDVATGTESWRSDLVDVRAVALARDRPWLAVVAKDGLELWDIDKRQRLRSWKLPLRGEWPPVLAISPDGARIVVALYRGHQLPRVFLWESHKDAPGKELDWQDNVDRLQFSPDGKTFFLVHDRYHASRGNESILLESVVVAFDAVTGKKMRERKYDFDDILLSPCCTQVAGYRLKTETLHLHAVDHVGVDPPALPFTIARRYRFAFTQDSKYLFVIDGKNYDIYSWDIGQNRKKLIADQRTADFDTRYHRHVPGTRLIPIKDNEYYNSALIQLLDVTTGRLIRYEGGHPSGVHGLAYSPDGKRLASCSRDTILIHDPATGQELHRWVGHDDQIEQIIFSPDGKLLATASRDRTVGLWDAATGQSRLRFYAPAAVHAIAFSSDGTALTAVCPPRLLQVWDVAKGTVFRSHEFAKKEEFGKAVLSPTARDLAAFEPDHFMQGLKRPGSPLRVVDAFSGQPRFKLIFGELFKINGEEHGKSTPSNAAFTTDGKLMALSSARVRRFDIVYYWDLFTVQVLETGSRREIARLSNVPSGSMRLLALSPDHRFLVHSIGSLGDSALMVHDLTRTKELTLKPPKDDLDAITEWAASKEFLQLHLGHRSGVLQLTFSPDGKHLATGDLDGMICIWDVAQFLKAPPPFPAGAKPANPKEK